jgi:putative inorganic carbon (hco3(-)) transporter
MELTDSASSSPLRPQVLPVVWQGQWIGILSLCCLLAFSWLPNSYYAMVGWPWILLWQIPFLTLGAWHVWVIRQFSIPFCLLGYGLDWLVGVALTVSLIAAIKAEFTAVAYWNVLIFANYVIALYLLVNWLRQGLSRKYLWFALSLAGTITSLVSLSFWRPSPEMWLSGNFSTALRNPWPLGHHNFVGGYTLLLLPIVLSFGISRQSRWKKGLGMSAAIAVALALYVSGSRGALLGAVTIFIVGVPVQIWQHRGRRQRRWLLGGAITLMILLGIVFSNPRMRSLFHWVPSPDSAQVSLAAISDGPTSDRLFMLRAAQDIFTTHPVIGVGSGNLSRVYNLYRPLEVGTGLELVQQLHNTPAQLLAELGVFGPIIYGCWLIALLRISVNLWDKLSQPADHLLFYGIIASYLGYSVSSLTDYQLENVGISSTLLLITALLINLSDTYGSFSAMPVTLSRRHRRFFSMGLLTFLCICFQLWSRFDAGVYLSGAAIKDINARNVVDADAKWAKAGDLVAWDPTYPALAAEQLISLRPGSANQEDSESLAQSAIEYLKLALEAAPNDTWLNQNLAVLLIESNQLKEAEIYAQRAAMLSPRNANYTYYTLGISYLQQNQTDQAIAAFSLEGMVNPEFLTADIWATETFADLLTLVTDKTLSSYRQILSQTAIDSPHYSWMNEQIAILSWWYQKPLEEVNTSKLRPLIQALLLIENEPQAALDVIERQIELEKENSSLELLQAWLAPEKYLEDYLKRFEGTQQEKDLLVKHINQTRDIRAWMASILQIAPQRLRNGVGFAYRNLSANNITQILYPGELRISFFANLLGVFYEAPVIFPQLDQTVSLIKSSELNLLPLNETRFQLPNTAS